MYQLEEFLSICQALSQKEFATTFHMPLLVIEKRGEFLRQQSSKIAIFETAAEIEVKNIAKIAEADKFANIRVYDFKEAQDRLLMISVGRTSSSCVCLKAESVSKLHAYFKFDKANGGWYIVDSESRNGTIVNGKTIPAKSPKPIDDRSTIWFGPAYFCRFFFPLSCYQYVLALPDRL